MSDSARATILSAIGSNGDPAAGYNAIERDYQSTAPLDLERFMERLREYGAGVSRCGGAEIAATVAGRLLARAIRSIAAPRDTPAEWLPSGLDLVFDDALTYRQLEACDGVITGCAVAIADTGTLILDGAFAQGRRALTLLPDYHLCVVFEDQVFATVPEAVEALSQSTARAMTWISGPSATADIEMTRIQGVHGPRSLDVILVRRSAGF